MRTSTILPHRHFGPLSLALLALVLAAAGALVDGSAQAAAEKPAGVGVVIIKKVVVGDGSDTTAFSGTIVKAQGNQLIDTFTALAQGSDLRYTGLANGTYEVTETEPTLLGYWKADGDTACPDGPSSRPNQDRAVISDVVNVVTICVYNVATEAAGDEVIVEGNEDLEGDSASDAGEEVIAEGNEVPESDNPNDGGDDVLVEGNEVPEGDSPGDDEDLLVLIIEDSPPAGAEPGIIDEVASDVAAGPSLAPGAPSTGTGLQQASPPRSSLSLLLFALAFMSAGGGLVLVEQRTRA